MALTLGVACGDESLAPESKNVEARLSGGTSSTMWQVTEQGLKYLGSIAAQVSVVYASEYLTTSVESIVRTNLPLSERKALAAKAEEATKFGPSRAATLEKQPLATSQVATRWRASLSTPRRHFKTKDGKDVGIQMINDPRGGGRPPMAVMVYDGDRPVSLNEYSFVKDGTHWRPTGSRSTLFDSTGRPRLIAVHDLVNVHYTSFGVTAASNASSGGLQRFGTTLKRFVQPDALYAAGACDEDGQCLREAIIVAGAEAAWAAGVVAAVAAYAACPATAGATCLAGLAAQAALVGLDIALGVAIGDYYSCTHVAHDANGNAYNRSGIGSGTLSAPGATLDCVPLHEPMNEASVMSPSGCYSEVWEISYDGGETWQYWSSVWVCPELNMT